MIACPYCAEHIQETAVTCRRCGNDLRAPTGRHAVPVPPAGRATPLLTSLSSPAVLAEWWRVPALAAAGTFGSALMSCALTFGAIYGMAVAGQSVTAPVPNPIQTVLLIFFQFHRVALSIDIPQSGALPSTFVFAPLGGLLLIGALHVIGGAFAGGATPRRNPIPAVLRYASVYAVLSFLASFLVSGGLPGAEGSPARVSVSAAGAFVMALLLATSFGLVGAAMRTYGFRWVRPVGASLERRLRGAGGAFVGAIDGLRSALGLALVGLFVVVALGIVVAVVGSPSDGGATSSAGPSDDDVRVLLIGLFVLLLVLPNLVVATLFGGMGATLDASATSVGPDVGGSIGIFGASGDGIAAGATAVDVPPYLLLLLLVPAVATVRAGYTAAGATSPGTASAMRAALGAGALMTVGCWLLAWICGGEMTTPVGRASIAVSPVAALFLPPLWTVGGACLGAFVHAARRQDAPVRTGAHAVPDGFLPAPPYIPRQADPAPISPVSAYAVLPYATAADPWPAQGPPAQGPPTHGAALACSGCGTPNHRANAFCEACGRNLAGVA